MLLFVAVGVVFYVVADDDVAADVVFLSFTLEIVSHISPVLIIFNI